MKTIGSVLKDQRERKGLSLEDISGKTKIRVNFLKALEENDFSKLPSDTVARGFIQVYARELDLDQKSALALFRRDFTSGDSGQIIPQNMLKPIRTRYSVLQKFRLPVILFGTIILIIVCVLGYQMISINSLPSVSLTDPKEGQLVKSPLLVRGKTATDVVVFINGKQTAIDQDGVFESSVSFDAGEHTVTVEIKNRQGKSKLVQRTVNVVE